MVSRRTKDFFLACTWKWSIQFCEGWTIILTLSRQLAGSAHHDSGLSPIGCIHISKTFDVKHALLVTITNDQEITIHPMACCMKLEIFHLSRSNKNNENILYKCRNALDYCTLFLDMNGSKSGSTNTPKRDVDASMVDWTPDLSISGCTASSYEWNALPLSYKGGQGYSFVCLAMALNIQWYWGLKMIK